MMRDALTHQILLTVFLLDFSDKGGRSEELSLLGMVLDPLEEILKAEKHGFLGRRIRIGSPTIRQ
jgi:hypothetical protein